MLHSICLTGHNHCAVHNCTTALLHSDTGAACGASGSYSIGCCLNLLVLNEASGTCRQLTVSAALLDALLITSCQASCFNWRLACTLLHPGVAEVAGCSVSDQGHQPRNIGQHKFARRQHMYGMERLQGCNFTSDSKPIAVYSKAG